MSRLDDPAAVAAQYASEANLRARQALYEEVSGDDPHAILWNEISALRPRNVVEVGGGPGELAERMQRELGARVAFVDVSERMVELARERGVDAQVGDVQRLPFPDGSFDLAVAAWMLYHVPDLDLGLSELARVLEPGGSLVAVTNSVHHLAELRALVGYPSGQVEPFNRENGEEHLRKYFSAVRRVDTELVVTVRDRAKLVAYQESMQIDSQPVPEDVALPFVIHALPTIFVATK